MKPVSEVSARNLAVWTTRRRRRSHSFP